MRWIWVGALVAIALAVGVVVWRVSAPHSHHHSRYVLPTNYVLP